MQEPCKLTLPCPSSSNGFFRGGGALTSALEMWMGSDGGPPVFAVFASPKPWTFHMTGMPQAVRLKRLEE